MISRMLGCTFIVVLAAGCQTTFTGDPHIADGRSGCEAKCKGQGMALAGMVYMGEYTSGCVCAVPGQAASTQGQMLAAAGAGAGAGSAGVVMQMRKNQDRQNRSNGLVIGGGDARLMARAPEPSPSPL